MRGGWSRFGLYVVAVASLIVLVFFATRGEPQTFVVITAQIAFVAVSAYLMTFVVWPRRTPQSAAHPSKRAPGPTSRAAARPEIDRRPVAVIENRPAGSEPGSRVHLPEVPTSRANRGRRPDDRQPTGEFRWPAQR